MSATEPRRLADQPAITPNTVIDYAWDWTDSIGSDMTVATCTWTCAVIAALPGSSADETPADRILGSPALDGNVATARLGTMRDGNDYRISIIATFDDGQADEVYFHQPCRAAR